MSTKIEKIGNYIVLTDLDTGHKDEYPSDNIYYRNDSDTIAFNHKFNHHLIHAYIWTELRDTDGNTWTDLPTLLDWLRKHTGDAGYASDYYLEVSRGEVDGVGHINKFGANQDVGADTTEDVWDGSLTYTFPKVADITHMHQDADQATLRGGKIELQGLDANWDAITQIALLDATDTSTPIAIPTPMIRIFRMKVMEDVVGASDIHVDNVGNTIHYAIMTAGNNQTLMAIYTVLRGKRAYLTNYYCTVIDAANKTPTSTVFKLWAADRFNGYEFQLKHAVGIPSRGNMTEHRFQPYGSVGQMTDIKITAHPEDEPANVAGGFGLILVDD